MFEIKAKAPGTTAAVTWDLLTQGTEQYWVSLLAAPGKASI